MAEVDNGVVVCENSKIVAEDNNTDTSKDNKRKRDESALTNESEGGSETSADSPVNKRQKGDDDNDTKTATTVTSPPSLNSDALKKQIEYYFGDENMKRDRFFHSKISADSEGWLDMKFILTCKKVQAMGATREDIIEALKSSDLETKTDEASNTSFLRRTTPLPPLSVESKANKGQNSSKGGGKPSTPQKGGGGGNKGPRCIPQSVEDIHQLGCFLKVTSIPEEVSWMDIKNGLKSKLPEGGGIRFVSTVLANQEVYAYAGKFDKDVEYFKETLNEISVNGSTLIVQLVDTIDEVRTVIEKILPKPIVKDREKDFMKLKSLKVSKPVQLGGSRFESVDHLRKCCRELLAVAPLGEDLKPAAYKVIRELLNYHPRAAEKTAKLAGIKVAERTDLPGQVDKGLKCFFIRKEDGSSEDFSIIKCIEALSLNPPSPPASDVQPDASSSSSSSPSSSSATSNKENTTTNNTTTTNNNNVDVEMKEKEEEKSTTSSQTITTATTIKTNGEERSSAIPSATTPLETSTATSSQIASGGDSSTATTTTTTSPSTATVSS